MSSARLVAIALLTAAASAASAQNAEKLGTVHFQTTCKPTVAQRFDRGVALLHSFEFAASIRAFNEVLAQDSACAMAYWGIALSR